jgi:hypothetical protein
LIHDSVAYLKSKGKEVIYDASIFSTAYADNAPMRSKLWLPRRRLAPT